MDDRLLSEKIAADWADRPYYESAEDPAWLAIFWNPATRFKTNFDRLSLNSILEIGCGHGRHTAQFVKRAGRVVVSDVNESNILKCRERFRGDSNVSFLINDGFSLEPIEDGSLESVFSYDAMVHFEFADVLNYIRECRRVLTLGGQALLHISDFSDRPGLQYNQNPHWRNFMSANVASHVAQRAGFEVVDLESFPWGGPVDGVQVRDALLLLRRVH